MRTYNYMKIKTYKDIKETIIKRESYKGFLYYCISSVLLIIPFLNYCTFKYETLRITYILGPHYGHDFDNYKECKKYLDDNNLMDYGKNFYNFYLNFYNLFVVIYLIYIYRTRKLKQLDMQKKILLSNQKERIDFKDKY